MFYKSNQMRFQVGGVSTLRRQTQERQYGDAAMLLQGLLQVLQHFEHYANIPQIKDMSTQLKQIQVSSVNFNCLNIFIYYFSINCCVLLVERLYIK